MKRSMISTMIKSMVNPESSAITRFFAQLDSVLMSHLVYANTLVFGAGDTFEFEFLAPTATTVGNEYLTDSSSGTRAWIYLHPDGTYQLSGGFTLEVDDVVKTTTSTYPVDGKLHKVKYTFTGVMSINTVGCRFSLELFYNGIIANPVATISGVTTSNTLGLATGNVEASVPTGPANAITYVNIPDAQREKFKNAVTQWDNISPLPQELPAVIEIA